jgi:hypothetical protein
LVGCFKQRLLAQQFAQQAAAASAYTYVLQLRAATLTSR